jgi:hypothetical protein
MSGVENFGRSPQAMQNLAPKPLARIRPAAFGEKLRAQLFRERSNLGGFVDT